MSNLEKYRKLNYTLPAKTLRWELSHGTLPDIELVEDAIPEPREDEILFRVDTNAICFSDVKVMKNPAGHPRMAGYDLAKDKLVPGHEMSITIVKAGKKAGSQFKPKARFLLQADLARYGQAVGYTVWGGMLQFGVWGPMVQDYLIPIPREMGYSQASLVEPWACVEASYRRVDVGPKDKSVLLLGGGGPMGQMHLERCIGLKRTGRCPKLETIMVTDISKDRLATVTKRYEKRAAAQNLRLICADVTGRTLDDALHESGVGGFDYIVALAAIESAVTEAKRHLREYGVLNLFAGFPRGAGALNMGDLHYDQHTVTGNSGSDIEDMKRVLALTQKGEVDTNYSVGAVSGFRAGKEGLMDVAAAKSNNKIVIYNQLADLPLTPVEELPKLVKFSRPVAASVAEGVWSGEAEAEMLEQLLKLD